MDHELKTAKSLLHIHSREALQDDINAVMETTSLSSQRFMGADTVQEVLEKLKDLSVFVYSYLSSVNESKKGNYKVPSHI